MLGKGYDGLYKASKMEERRKRRLRGERDQIKFIDLGFEGWHVVRFKKARGSHKLHVLGMNDDLWDKFT